MKRETTKTKTTRTRTRRVMQYQGRDQGRGSRSWLAHPCLGREEGRVSGREGAGEGEVKERGVGKERDGH